MLAEEQAFTVREREIAERRKVIDLISAARDAERERLRLTAKAEAEKEAAASFAEARRLEAHADADAQVIRAEAAAQHYKVEADGQRRANEADNILSDAARASRTRRAIIDEIEGIVRESVRPMEKIENIKIVHVEGLGGSGGDGAAQERHRRGHRQRSSLSRAGADDRQPDEGYRHRGIEPRADVGRDPRRQGPDLDRPRGRRKRKGEGDGEAGYRRGTTT